MLNVFIIISLKTKFHIFFRQSKLFCSVGIKCQNDPQWEFNELKEYTRNILLKNHLKKLLNYFAELCPSYLNFASQSPLKHDARNNPVLSEYHELHDDAWGNRKQETYVKETEW